MSPDQIHSNDPDAPKVTRSRRLKAVIWSVISSLVFSLLVLPMSVRVYRTWGIPDAGHPFDVEAYGTVDLPDDQNARLDYEAAIGELIPLPERADRKLANELHDAVEQGWASATPEIRQWLDDNHPALERWRRGTEKPDFLFVQPKFLTATTSIDALQVRTLARLATLESSRILANNQPEDAWPWSRAILLFSRHVGQHGSIIERLFGVGLYQAGATSTLEIAQDPAVSEELLRRMLQETRSIYATTAPQSNTIKSEHLSLNNTINDPNHLLENDAGFGERFTMRMGSYFTAEFRLVELLSQHYVANVLDQIDLPMKDRQPRVGSLELFQRDPKKNYPAEFLPPDAIERLSKKSMVFSMMVPMFRQVDYACLKEHSRQHALEICLALRIYHKTAGVYPRDLDALVEKNIIDDIPFDPLSITSEPMHYRRVGDEALVWSVGLNGIDDDGEIDQTDRDHGLLDVGLKLGDSVEAKKP